MRKILHAIFGCTRVLIGWSVMAAPIERCAVCDQLYVTYGYGYPMPITAKNAEEIGFSALNEEEVEA